MIKDVFKFKKTSWHARLMKFVWGYTPNDFPNMCPYFWLSVFNVVFILPILPIKLLGVIIFGLSIMIEQSKKNVEQACDNKATRWMADKLERLWIDEELATNVARVGMILSDRSWVSKSDEKYEKIYWGLSQEDRMKIVETYREKLERIQKEYEDAYEARRTAKLRAEADRKATIGRMTVGIKKVFNIVIWPILLFILYLLYKLVTMAITWDYSWISTALYVIYICGGTGLGVYFIIYSVRIFGAWVECKLRGACLPCEIRKRRLNKFFGYFSFLRYAANPFILIGLFFIGIWKGLVLFKDIIVAFKQNNCPSIDWED